MDLSTTAMSYILGVIGILMYFFAPFMSDSKKALSLRIGGEVFIGLMYLYQGHLAGISYYLLLAFAALFEKQIEKNQWFSLGYGIVACIITCFVNNNGIPGYVLAVSLVVVFLHIDDEKRMTFSSYLEALTALAVLYYSLSVRVWVGVIFAVFLLLLGIASLVSAVKISRSGGMEAVIREEREYQKKQNKKKK